MKVALIKEQCSLNNLCGQYPRLSIIFNKGSAYLETDAVKITI